MSISDNLVLLNNKVEALIVKAQSEGGDSNIIKGSFSVSEDCIEYTVSELGFMPAFLIVCIETGSVPNLSWGGCVKGLIFSDVYTSSSTSITITRRGAASGVTFNDDGFSIETIAFSGYQTYLRAGKIYNYWAFKEM